jgi:hypothetical protein
MGDGEMRLWGNVKMGFVEMMKCDFGEVVDNIMHSICFRM